MCVCILALLSGMQIISLMGQNMSPVSCLVISHSILSHNLCDLWGEKKLLNIKYILIFSTTFETSHNLRRTELDDIINALRIFM